ncbi:hypothetical protein [Nocardia amamiensis]|uniref:hypothetical protein n=1 Tax=Nocardia amamiensis TaxID=404578 RepID=UPI000A4E29CD|nr:hypothetical protein [Nocardia amamiensis]
MTTALSDRHIPRELEPAERPPSDHLRKPTAWNPHDSVQCGDRREFSAMGRVDQEPGRSEFPGVVQTAVIEKLRIPDGVSSYHRKISASFDCDGVWVARSGRCSAEENELEIQAHRFEEQCERAAARQAERAATAL